MLPDSTCRQCGGPAKNQRRDKVKQFCSARCRNLGNLPKHPPLSDRFWSHVDTSGECWVWTAARASKRGGYGRFGIENQQTEYAHRVSWRLAYGPIPTGLWVLHHCDNPPCVRPSHLFLGTQVENMADMTIKGRHGSKRAA